MGNAALSHTRVGHDEWQQDQVGQNNHSHPDTRCYRQVLNDSDINNQQGRKTNPVTDECNDSRLDQIPERRLCRIQRGFALGSLMGNSINNLDTVADPYSKDQKRYQNRENSETVTKQVQ